MTIEDLLEVLELDENVIIINSENTRIMFEGVSQNVPEELNDCVIDSISYRFEENALLIMVQ